MPAAALAQRSVAAEPSQHQQRLALGDCLERAQRSMSAGHDGNGHQVELRGSWVQALWEPEHLRVCKGMHRCSQGEELVLCEPVLGVPNALQRTEVVLREPLLQQSAIAVPTGPAEVDLKDVHVSTPVKSL